MIHESYPWKQDLLRRKRLIIKYNTAERYIKNEKTMYTVIEKGIFYSAFIIRKLIDCKTKLSDEADNYSMHIKAIKPLRNIDSMHNWPKFTNYDWESERDVTVAGKNICNWLMHSFVFFVGCQEDGVVMQFYVASDYDRNNVLYKILLADWLKYIDYIATDYIVEINSRYDERIKDYRYNRKKRGTL